MSGSSPLEDAEPLLHIPREAWLDITSLACMKMVSQECPNGQVQMPLQNMAHLNDIPAAEPT